MYLFSKKIKKKNCIISPLTLVLCLLDVEIILNIHTDT